MRARARAQSCYKTGQFTLVVDMMIYLLTWLLRASAAVTCALSGDGAWT